MEKCNESEHTATPPSLSRVELKFKKAQTKLQAAVRKHAQNYESSSEEEELESENIIGELVKNYIIATETSEFLDGTKDYLRNCLLSGSISCLICISRIRRESEIWHCIRCYGIFHLNCIQRWSKDSIYQQKQIHYQQTDVNITTLNWCCPKCRISYQEGYIPEKYVCFCGKTTNPEVQPFLVPHSCGEICAKELTPLCGHKCLLLCHPGPCPPCPVTINIRCHCGTKGPVTRRCSDKKWSCGRRCGKLLLCQKHYCEDSCHAGDCNPCLKKSLQKCICKEKQKIQDCSSPLWRCDKVCNKPLSCGNHNCPVTCHSGDCESCSLAKLRYCPCGKTKYQLPCIEETPTCPDTCEKILECGIHLCSQRCHKEPCGVCTQIVKKSCKCGLHSKEVQCCKPYACETKCKRMRDCSRHPCNKKCCDGNCPPCEKICGRTLKCGNHKCSSICHRGLCYPCSETEAVSCQCGQTKIFVPCGRKYKTKPPKCDKLCLIPPNCHHELREPHKCHFGDCSPCRQICNKRRPNCEHLCTSPCHSAVLVKIVAEKPSMPWERTEPLLERKALPCPACEIPVSVTCLGGHETAEWPCFDSMSSSCQRPCGRLLHCRNHTCTIPCHTVNNASDLTMAGDNCERCENPCTIERPADCQHECPRPCHPGPCPPCKQMLRIRCHCGLNQPYVSCNEWQVEDRKEELQSCGNQCPKNYDCGHRCRSICHSGACPNSEMCKKKVKLTCKCKRLRKEFSCELVRKQIASIECDEICIRKKIAEEEHQRNINEQKQKEENLRNEKELAKYKKLFENKKKIKCKRSDSKEEELTFVKKYLFSLISFAILIPSVFIFYLCYIQQ